MRVKPKEFDLNGHKLVLRNAEEDEAEMLLFATYRYARRKTCWKLLIYGQSCEKTKAQDKSWYCFVS